MADYSQDPTALDVELLLKSAKFWPVGGDSDAPVLLAREQADTTVKAAVREFQNRTGHRPFVAKQTATTRYFQSTDFNGYLDFNRNAVSIESVTVGGTTYTQDSTWFADPINAEDDDVPYSGVQFTTRINGPRPNHIAVAARWGRYARWPQDAWLACMRLAAAQTLGQIENAQGLSSISQDGFSKGFDVVGIITQKDLLETLTKRFEAIVKTYTRISC